MIAEKEEGIAEEWLLAFDQVAGEDGRLRLRKMIPIRASVTQIDLQESGRSWIEVEIDVPGQCERIELDLEELGASAYAPPLLNSPQGLRKLWITQDGPPTINVGETIAARSFTKGESAE